MKKQKICVIGDGLAGLMTALVLSKSDIQIDLIFKNKKVKKFTDCRTTAISENNYKSLINFIGNKYSKIFFESKEIIYDLAMVNLFPEPVSIVTL